MTDLAARRHGVVTAAQLRGFGLSKDAITRRIANGRLNLVHRGVYAVGHTDLSDHGLWLAAVYAAGHGAVLSHLSAACLWGFWTPRDADAKAIHVAVARHPRPRPGIHLHPVRALDPRDITQRHRIPVTTADRTLLDLSATLTQRALRRTVHEALVQQRVSLPSLRAQLAHANGKRGTRRLAAILDDGAAPTDSELEDRFLELVTRYGLPRPLTKQVVAGVKPDFLFPSGLVVETDGALYHDTPMRRASDAEKQARLEAAGYPVLRVSWVQATRRAAQTARRIARANGRGEAADARGEAANGRGEAPDARVKAASSLA